MSKLYKFAVIPDDDFFPEYLTDDSEEALQNAKGSAEVDGQKYYLFELKAVVKPTSGVTVEEIK